MTETAIGRDIEESQLTASARLEGALALRFEDFRWTHRMTISDLVRAAIEDYLDRADGVSPKLPEHEVQLQQARLIVQQARHCSIGLLQRHMRVPYALAEKLVNEMTARGWVTAAVGESGPDETPDITTP